MVEETDARWDTRRDSVSLLFSNPSVVVCLCVCVCRLGCLFHSLCLAAVCFRSPTMFLSDLPAVLAQSCMHGLTRNEILFLARCCRSLMGSADSAFAWRACPPLCGHTGFVCASLFPCAALASDVAVLEASRCDCG